jgi:hypothetical protein
LIDSVIVRVGADRSHAWKGKGEEMSERMSGGCGGREEEMKGSGLQKVRACGKGTWQQLASKQQVAKRGSRSAGKRNAGERE